MRFVSLSSALAILLFPTRSVRDPVCRRPAPSSRALRGGGLLAFRRADVLAC